MAKVSITAKIFPEDPARLQEVKDAAAVIVPLSESYEEEIGFGVKVLIIRFLRDEDAGVDVIEEKLAGIPGVSQVQITSVDRVEL